MLKEDSMLFSTDALTTTIPTTLLLRQGNGIGSTRGLLISDMLSLNLSTELTLSSSLREHLPASLPDSRPCTKGAAL